MANTHKAKAVFPLLSQAERERIITLLTMHSSQTNKGSDKVKRSAQLISSSDPSMLVYPNQWNTSGRIKPGSAVKHCPHCDAILHVLAVDPIGFCITANPDTNEGFRYARIEDLGRPARLPRLSVQENARHQFRFLAALQNHPLMAVRWLLAMFHGEMGQQYANLAAEAWIVRAGSLANGADSSPELVAWSRYVLQRASDLDIPMDDLPPELPALAAIEDPGTCTVSFSDHWPMDQVLDQYTHSVEQAQAHALEMLNGPDLGPPPQDSFELPRGTLAFCSQQDTTVLVLGPSIEERDPGYFDVIDLDDLNTYPAHGLELERDDEEIEEWELLEILEEARPWTLPIYYFLASYPWKTLTIPPALDCLINLSIFRMATEKQCAAVARNAYRQARESYRALSKEERKPIIALAPEINAPKGGVPAARGTAGAILVAVNKMVDDINEQMSSKLEGDVQTPASSTLDTSSASEVHDQEPTALPDNQEPVAQPACDHEDECAAAAEDSPAEPKPPVRYDQALRFPVKDHRLLAMEWELVQEDGAYDRAVASTLTWLGGLLGVTLPDTWQSGGHEIELGGVRVQLESGDRIFALRMEHPDNRLPARTWRVEAMLIAGVEGTGGMAGIRVGTQDRTPLPTPYTGLPRLVSAWQQSPGLMLGGKPTASSWQVRTAKEFAAWQASLGRPRQYLMTVTTDPAGFAPPPPLCAALMRVTMLREAVALYEEVYGRIWEDNIHVFTPENPGPRNWYVAEYKGISALTNVANEHRQRPATPTFKQVRDMVRNAAAAQRVTSTAPVDSASTTATQDPVPAVRAQAHPSGPPAQAERSPVQDGSSYRADELQQMLDIALADHALTQNELEASRAELALMRNKLKALQAQFAIRSDETPAPEEIPDSLDKLPQWVTSLQPRLVIVDKALKVAARTEHKEVGKIYRGLQALATDYWSSRFDGDEQAYARWSEFLKENRMRWGPVGVANDISRYQDEYVATHEGRSYTMTHHLQGSSSRDPTRCIRIYVAVDEERKVIVVGALPAHLTNTHS